MTEVRMHSFFFPLPLPRHDYTRFVTKRRNSWACRGNPNPEQETIKGTHDYTR